uniref:LIM homeobox 9 n=1 Tax=Athene cunicularia TaxID=194338 RepID=A0A663LIQ1_ATHCN
MLFHGISGGHIQGIMEEMERRSKTESRLAKGGQMNGSAHKVTAWKSALSHRVLPPFS